MAITGAGTYANPYIIYNADDYNSFLLDKTITTPKYWGKSGIYVELGGDLDFSGKTFHFHLLNEGTATFNGNFDGKGYSVKNIILEEDYISSVGKSLNPQPSTTNMASFSFIKTGGSGGVFRNISFYNISLTGLKHWRGANNIIYATGTKISNVYIRKIRANISSFTPFTIQGSTTRVKDVVIENVEHYHEGILSNAIIVAPIYYVQGGGTLTENMLENIVIYNFHSDVISVASAYLYSTLPITRLAMYENLCKNSYSNINDRNRGNESFYQVNSTGFYPFKNTTYIETEDFRDSSLFALPSDYWDYDYRPYLKTFGVPSEFDINSEKITVQSFMEQINGLTTTELINFVLHLIEVFSEVKQINSESHKILSRFAGSHSGAFNSDSNKKVGLNQSSHLDTLESVLERQIKITKNIQSYMNDIQAYTIMGEIKRLLIELKMELGNISSEIKSTTKIKNKIVTNSLNNISTNINTIAKVKNMISNSYISNIDTSSIEERIKFINNQSLVNPYEANVFKGKYARIENFAQALSTHIAEQHKKKSHFPVSKVAEIDGTNYVIKKLLKSVLSDLDVITSETLTETRFFLEKWVKVQAQMKQHKTKLDYANWGV